MKNGCNILCSFDKLSVIMVPETTVKGEALWQAGAEKARPA